MIRRVQLSLVCFLLILSQVTSLSVAGAPQGRLVFDCNRGGHFGFAGPVGRRIDANRRNWLLRAPGSNPGMLGMFRVRDRKPAPNLVPWAGEFVGKYLISAVQALRMTDDPALERTVRTVVRELVASQAEDGYLGPFPKPTRLLAHWDLWGHYHCMLALLMWHEQTGDEAALQSCLAAADLVCKTYLDTQRRVFDAGSHEMNMAIIHVLGKLYRQTGRPRYLRMIRAIEQDWQRAGDYFRTGLAGVEFFRTPKPRWESLHDLQGLVELYRITGDSRYRTAFLNLWQSIRHWDRRNSGAFSSGEQADGDPYKPSAIETCCTIAWMAMTVDVIRLTGDPAAADELELATLNLVMGAQHPSGSWWTYNTPMSGVREASADTIVFQARAGTPELNCCSVNGPRGLGILSEWALMRSVSGLVVNYLGPMRATFNLADGTAGSIIEETKYPLAGTVRIVVRPDKPAAFPVKVRIPTWAEGATIQVPGADATAVKPGTYFQVRRTWQPGDQLLLDFHLKLRYVAGDREMFGKMSIYRGPLLLAYDTRHNTFDQVDLPALTPAALAGARVSFPKPNTDRERIGQFMPMLFVEIPRVGGRKVRLCDFGTAGCTGSRYASWLPARDIVPPAPVPDSPPNGARVPPGPFVFTWRPPAAAALQNRTHTVLVARTPDFKQTVFRIAGQRGHHAVVSKALARRLKPGVDYYWQVMASNRIGTTASRPPAKRFRVDPKLPPLRPEQLSEFGARPDGTADRPSLECGDWSPLSFVVRSRKRRPSTASRGRSRVGGNMAIQRVSPPQNVAEQATL